MRALAGQWVIACLIAAGLAGCATPPKGASSTPPPPCGLADHDVWEAASTLIRFELWMWNIRQGLTEAEELAVADLDLLAWYPRAEDPPVLYVGARTATREGQVRWHLLYYQDRAHPAPLCTFGLAAPAGDRPRDHWVSTHPISRAGVDGFDRCLRGQWGMGGSTPNRCSASSTSPAPAAEGDACAAFQAQLAAP